MTDTAPTPIVRSSLDDTDTAAQPTVGHIPTPVPWRDHIAARPLTHRRQDDPTLEQIVSWAAWALVAALILVLGFGDTGLIAWTILLLLTTAIVWKFVLSAERSWRRLHAAIAWIKSR